MGEDDHVARLRFGERLSQEMPDARLAPCPHRALPDAGVRGGRDASCGSSSTPDPVAPQAVATTPAPDGGAP
ncbi:MAG: hypothetical protein U0325_16660 [Polyangiales bacterium]